MQIVRWRLMSGNECVGFGKMNKRELAKFLYRRSLDAAKLQEATGADHVIYGVKYFGESGKVDEVGFYMKAMNDKEFEAVQLMRDVLIYAVHKH